MLDIIGTKSEGNVTSSISFKVLVLNVRVSENDNVIHDLIINKYLHVYYGAVLFGVNRTIWEPVSHESIYIYNFVNVKSNPVIIVYRKFHGFCQLSLRS